MWSWRIILRPREGADVVGLYLAPPENVVVLYIDAKSQIQALDRTRIPNRT